MISALAWLPRGCAKACPEMFEPTEEELETAREEAGEDEEDSAEEMVEPAVKKKSRRAKALAAAKAVGDLAGNMDELDMDNYDDDSDEDGAAARLFGSTASDRFYENNEEDPDLQGDADSEDEIQDFTIRDTDLLFLTAKTEDDVSHLEVWVYEEPDTADEDGNMYVHHDLMLPAFPLCLAWMDCYPDPSKASQHGNFVAIGTFRPEIEIWDLDLLDAVAPAGMLGGLKSEQIQAPESAASSDKKKKKKKKKAKEGKVALKEGSHEDAVLGLSWNYNFRNVLASGSADCTVKVWDVAEQRCDRTLHHHDSKVQAVAWNPVEPQVLLTGGFDQTAQLLDMRTESGSTVSVPLTADCECLAWDPKNPSCFVVSSEDGLVVCHDVRMLMDKSTKKKSTIYTLSAHDKATCAMSFNPVCPELLATASTDKTVKLWDTTDGKPSLLHSADLKVGAVFAMGFSKDAPHLLSAGGSLGLVSVWDIMTKASIAKRFGTELSKHARYGASKIVSDDVVIGPDADIEDDEDSD